MSHLKSLVMMQLKDKIDFSFLHDKKKTMFKIVYNILLFAVITAAIYLIFSLIISFGIFSFLRTLNFHAFLVLMTVIFVLSFIACLTKVTKTLFFAKDNPVLITMPVKNTTIFFSKLIVCFLYELLRNVMYILPFFLAYGLAMNLGITYFLWSLLSLVFFTFIVVSVSGILAIPTMYLMIAFKKHRLIELIFLGVIIGVVVYGIIYVIDLIPPDIDLVRDWGRIYWHLQDFLNGFAATFAFMESFLQLLTGMAYNTFAFNPITTANLITLGVCLGIIIVSFVLIYFLSRPLFLKMISTPFEYKKNENIKHKKNHKNPAFISSVNQQSKQIFRTANIIYAVLAVAVFTPIAILIQDKIIDVMDIRLTGRYMMIAFNVLIIMLLTMSSNTLIASIFSREGNSAYLNKIHPVAYYIPLSGKIILNAGLCVVSIIVSVILMAIFAGIGIFNTIILTITLILFYLAHLLWSAEMDIMNPQNQQYQTTGDQQKNPNETKSTIFGFIIAAVLAFIAYLLMSENFNVVFIKLLFISILFFSLRCYLYFTKIKLYYKEK